MKNTFSRIFTVATVILLLALVLMGTFFQFLVRDYLTDSAMETLLQEANSIAALASNYAGTDVGGHVQIDLEFQGAQAVCKQIPQSAEVIRLVKEKGLRVALATNPIFPAIATHKRVGWAGLSVDDFELITTYENSHSCKPNPAYYQEILKKLNVKAENCLMVGNDVTEDMVAETLGMKVFLLTDCIINKNNADISHYPSGSFDELITFIQNL